MGSSTTDLVVLRMCGRSMLGFRPAPVVVRRISPGGEPPPVWGWRRGPASLKVRGIVLGGLEVVLLVLVDWNAASACFMVAARLTTDWTTSRNPLPSRSRSRAINPMVRWVPRRRSATLLVAAFPIGDSGCAWEVVSNSFIAEDKATAFCLHPSTSPFRRPAVRFTASNTPPTILSLPAFTSPPVATRALVVDCNTAVRAAPGSSPPSSAAALYCLCR
mmetsp:Transcript_49470/g.108045  ORF Transcript_49470/g.108045 Transcript_49470/m.108045 type:complete len:218 (-) Transcript_49470:39-692(-)